MSEKRRKMNNLKSLSVESSTRDYNYQISINLNVECSLENIYASPHFTHEQKAEMTLIAFGLKKPESLSKENKSKLIRKIAVEPETNISKQEKKNLINEFIEDKKEEKKVLGTFKFSFPTSNFDNLTLDSFFADEEIKK